MTIQVESEIIRGMAGEVRYHTKPCPHSEKGIGNAIAMVGSSQCMMCRHYGGTEKVSDLVENVVCNHK